ncbi:MAG: HD domain-containing protein [Nitrososphaerales archaeon]
MSQAAFLKFFEKVNRLKEEKRKGWVTKANIKDCESVASHTFQLALMAMLFSRELGLDELKAIKISLIHDLPEALIGDHIPEEYQKGEKEIKEDKAFKRLFSLIPKRDEYEELWKEYKEQKSKESRLVKQLDALEMALQGLSYYKRYKSRNLLELIDSASSKVKDRYLNKVLQLSKSKSIRHSNT